MSIDSLPLRPATAEAPPVAPERHVGDLISPPVPLGGRRRRVLVVHSSDELYGSDRMVLEVVGELAGRDDLDVTVWLPRDVPVGPLGSRLRELGARVERRRTPILRRSRLSPRGLVRLALDSLTTMAGIRAAHVDMVYCTTSAVLVVAPLARAAGIGRVLGHLHELWGPREGRVLRFLAKSCTTIVTVSESVAAAARLSDDPRTVVVPNGVPRRSAAVPPEGAIRPPHYLVASRWNTQKGHATLLTAWNAAGCPGQLTVLGGPPAVGSSVDVPGLVSAIVSHPETVTIVGEVDDATPYVRDADVVLLPTDTVEGFGLVAVEAFSEGRPVIASRSGGPEEVVADGRTGWLFDRGDVDALTHILADMDLDTARAAGRLAFAEYERAYTTDRMRRRIGAVVSLELWAPTSRAAVAS